MTPFNKENFISARFINDLRTDIEVLFVGPTGTTAAYVQVDTSQEDLRNLLKIVSIDELNVATARWIEQQREIIFNFHKKIIEKNNVVEKQQKEIIFKEKNNELDRKSVV